MSDLRVHWLQHVPFEGLGSIETWLATRRSRVTSTRLYRHEPLPSPDDLDLVIAMGGPMSVNDDGELPWLIDEMRFIREAIERDVAVLGVCLGSQLIARSLGARIYRNPEREIGWWPIVGLSSDEDAPTWARDGVETTVFHWHGETFDLPAGSVPLARSTGCAQQAFQVGRRAIGLQFHLETMPSSIDALVSACPLDLAPGRFVQSSDAMCAADQNQFDRIGRLMTETLDYMCPPA